METEKGTNIGIMSDLSSVSPTIRVLTNSEKTSNSQKNTENETISANSVFTLPRIDTYEAKKIDGEKNVHSAVLYNGILKQIKEQTLEMLKTGIPGKISEQFQGKTIEALNEFFVSEPGAIKEVQKGSVPEYWNVENTGRRIVDIALAGFSEGMDREEFYERAKGLITGAYDDVHSMLSFDYPELVKNTREAVLAALDQFKEGVDVGELVFA